MTEKSKTPLLDKYTENLSEKVSKKPDDFTVYGRDVETNHVIISLLRRTKNNPILVGEAGVGKTAIVENLALLIHRGLVPDRLKKATVRSLELSSLMGSDDGGFVAKFKGIIEEAIATFGETLLFIDEFHTIVGAGGTEDTALDAGNVIKPALARGEIQLIGATTLDEFHEYVETDRALERRMQPIMVKEPTVPEAITIIESAKKIYESYHHVTITSEAVEQAVKLSARYITDRFLPDKAFDLLDEAATIANVEGSDSVTDKAIAEVLKEKTGIPLTTILKGNQERLEMLEPTIRKRVKGQEHAISLMVGAIKIAQAGLQDESKPLVSAMFLGPSGCGKTELAKAIAEALFDDENAMIRFDMSEYQRQGDAIRLIGDPKTKSKGLLTEQVKRKPYSVLLFDEVEKGHREVHDLLLQVLDDGHLTDSSGRKISFKNTIVIQTTNVGSRKVISTVETKGPISELNMKDLRRFDKTMETELKTIFRPEYLNRIDYKITFDMLNRPIIKEIVGKNLEKLETKLERQGMSISVSQDVIDYLADNGTEPENGARPLARLMKRVIEAPISDEILNLQGDDRSGKRISVWVEGQNDDERRNDERRQLKFSIETPSLFAE